MDNITQCVLEAQKRGMSYGQYMALYGKGVPQHKRRTVLVDDVHEVDEDEAVIIKCKHCGEEFAVKRSQYLCGRRYCSDECYRLHNAQMAKERYYKRREAKLAAEAAKSSVSGSVKWQHTSA